MTSPFSYAAFQAEQRQAEKIGPRRPSPLSYEAFLEEQREEEERIRAERGARDGVLPAVVTTAPAPKPFERALARGVMASGATAPAFGREEDLTPLARQQVERAKAARAVAEDLGKAVVGQPMRSATRLAAGAATLAGLPQAEPLTRVMRSIEEQTAPTTTPGALARVGTEIGAMAPGGFALGATRAALESAAGESTVNALLEATGRAPIESPMARALAEAGLDVAALGVGKALRAGGRGARQARQAPDVTPPLALPPGPIRDRGRLLGPGAEAPVQGPVSSRPIPMGGATTGAVPTVGSETLGPGIPMPSVRQLFLPRRPRPTEGAQVLGPAIPMGGPEPPRRLTSGAPRSTPGTLPLGPEPLPPESPVFGPAIPMRGVPTGPTPITDPTRLLPSSVPDDVTRRAVQERWAAEIAGPPPAAAAGKRRPRMTAARRGAVASEALVPAGTAGLGAILGAATTPEEAPESMIGRAMAGALAGFGAGRVGLRGVERLADATAARRGTAAIPEGIPDGVSVPDRAAAMREAALRTAPEEVVTPRPGMTEARMERAAERVQRPARPTPSDATYVPRTDEEWREFYGRFMTRPEDIAEADALRQTGVTQQRQGTRPVALDTKLSETIGETFGDLAFRDAGRKLSGPELIALRAQREANAARRVALAERLADPNLSPVDREWMTSLRDRLEDVMITQLERYTRDVSQTGRDLRLLQEAVKLSDNPADWLLRAERMAGGQKLTPAQELELITAVREKNLPKAAGLIGKLRETSRLDRLGELWQTGLLTSVMRPLRDVLGNFINLADKQAERVVATGVDRLLGLTTGVRTADYSLPATAKAFGPALQRGGEAAMAILRGKGDPAVLERVMKRYDFERETLQTNPMLRAYTTLIRRTIGAADALVSEVAMTAALGEQARVLARNKGLTEGTPAFQEAVAKYLDAPPPEMFGIAAAQAAEVTWQNPTVAGPLGVALRQAKSPEVRLAGKLLMPFFQTPSAMGEQAFRGTPFGLYGAHTDVLNMAKKADLPAAQRQFVGRIAKSTVGAGWIALGYSLADNDQMTSWFPSDDRERRRWELEGRTETAVKIGGTWVSLLGVLGPQAMLMSIGAALRKLTDDPEFVQRTVLDKAVRTALTIGQGAGRAVLDSPMMQGMRTVTELGQQIASGDPEGLAQAGTQAAQTFLGGMVPQVVQQVARATDLTDEGTVRVRQPRVAGDPARTALNAVLQGIPFGARQMVPVRRTALGEERATSVGGLAGVLSPARLSRETSDPRAQELWRTGAAVPRTTQRRGEPAETFSARQEALGGAVARAVQAAMNDPQYQAIARMPAADLRAALRAQVAERGADLPELQRLDVLPDDEIRRRYQGMVLDNVIRAARTQAGAAFPDPRGGRAGSILQSLTRP
jgi:hypothetical protein